MHFSLVVGQRFQIAIGHEANGKLDFPVPEPNGPELHVLSRDDATVTYLANESGTTRLIAHRTIYCARPGPKIKSCPVAVVHVRR
jgi:hypothetical protein